MDGTTVGEDLRSTGFLGADPPGRRPLDCFIETHIEQGPILGARGKTIGVVTQIVGIRWSTVTVTGQDAHAGTTPMDRRHDALLGAAQMLTALNEIARKQDDSARLTVGRLQVFPNSGATIPGKVIFVFDLRHPDQATLESLEQRMHTAIAALAEQHGLEVAIERAINVPPLRFARELIDTIRSTADHLGYSNIDMLSGAGHDAMNVARVAPTAMIFVPCKNGLSHNEAESATPDDLAAGAHTLLRATRSRGPRLTQIVRLAVQAHLSSH
ncbi:MAG: hydantoinase/carbamoylase family amidase [Gammaproteobacteria bacterium]